ncbi:MAG: ribosome silencing factor [Gammaproteobacteria bacterium]|nr:ribosome silencing factor [Gammaproteobacteria bacterium]
MQSKETQEIIYQIIDDAKAQDIIVLDIRNISDIADYMVIASGTSARHVSSVADKLVDKMKEQGRRPLGLEGKETGEWVLVDYGDVIVHIMRPEARQFYNLEKLWGGDEAHGIAES